MKIQRVRLNDLIVNRANDRHGELISQDAAFEWLLTHRGLHMRNLAKDIVQSQQIYEPPLVREENGKFVVYDGNRRVTALKLLGEPQMAPSQDWAEFFSELRSAWNGEFPEDIECQVEQDRERLDEILYRKHTGQQSGVGQSQWDAEAKSNFQKRTGKNTKVDIAEEIERLLRSAGRLHENDRIPRSNMKRLLSAEQFRNRAGIAVEKNKLKFTHDEEKVLGALEKIARDLISKRITLDNLWDNDAKRRYLDELDRSGVLPTAADALRDKRDAKAAQGASAKASSKRGMGKATEPEKRRTLIRNLDFGLQQSHHNRRALDIFSELQHRLRFNDHDNAIAVLFRVLLELSIEIYIEQKKVLDVQRGDKLSKKFSKALTHMHSAGLIDKKYHDNLKKFEQSEPLFSTHTLHAYIHSPDFFPSDHHLKNMWDTLELFTIRCLKS